jgi:hypothetical protein
MLYAWENGLKWCESLLLQQSPRAVTYHAEAALHQVLPDTEPSCCPCCDQTSVYRKQTTTGLICVQIACIQQVISPQSALTDAAHTLEVR